MLRKPIVTFLGHVDHGKTSILDKIRGTAVASKEAGGITQAIGASIIPIETILKVCKNLTDKVKMKFDIPGILFIDSPGHAAFTNLRKRGGNLADIAILVVDINEGLKPQTIEAIEILKSYKTPFIIAANKIDMISGYKMQTDTLLQDIAAQGADVRAKLDERLYQLVGQLHEKFRINSDRFDRVDDYTKTIAIVPCSAVVGIGIPEILMVLTGLTQKYLEKGLHCDLTGMGRGTIMEVKETKGHGTTIDVILHDGNIKVNDQIVIGNLGDPIVTRVRSLLEPAPMAEMRDAKAKFIHVKQVCASTGVKIAGPGLDDALSGMPIIACSPNEVEEAKEEVLKEIDEVVFEIDQEGIILKADSLGSLEALINMLQEKQLPIQKAAIGKINKKDVADAESNIENHKELATILGFNVPEPEFQVNNVKVITSPIIYELLDRFDEWQEELTKQMQTASLDSMTRPCKITLLHGYVFRQNNPAVCGVEVNLGRLKAGTPLMKDGKQITTAKSLQKDSKSVSEVQKDDQAAVSMPHVTIGRQLHEGEILYSALSDEEFRKYKELKKLLKEDEIQALKEIAKIMRKNNPVWGV